MYIVEIDEGRIERMSGLAEEMLSAGGRLMQCIDELSGEGRDYGERSRYADETRMRDDRRERRDVYGREMPDYGERRGARRYYRY